MEAIQLVRRLINSTESRRDLYMVFIDLEKVLRQSPKGGSMEIFGG